jgi:hypothetical protein
VVPGARGNGIASKLLDNILGHFPGQEMRLKPQPFEDERWPGEDGLDEDQRRSFYRSRGFEDDRPREDGDWEGWERMMRHAVGKGISHEQLSDAIEDYGEAGLPPSCYEPSRAGGWCRDVSHEFAARLGALGHHDHSVRDVHRGGGEIHTVNRVNVEGTPHVVDWTGRQYDPDVDVPHVEPWFTWEQRRYRYGNKSIWKSPAKEWCPDCGHRLDSPGHAREHERMQKETVLGRRAGPGPARSEDLDPEIGA